MWLRRGSIANAEGTDRRRHRRASPSETSAHELSIVRAAVTPARERSNEEKYEDDQSAFKKPVKDALATLEPWQISSQYWVVIGFTLAMLGLMWVLDRV